MIGFILDHCMVGNVIQGIIAMVGLHKSCRNSIECIIKPATHISTYGQPCGLLLGNHIVDKHIGYHLYYGCYGFYCIPDFIW